MLLAQCVPTVPPTEFCDGIDNDCDGIVDEAAGSTYDLNLIAESPDTKISNPGSTVADQTPEFYITGDSRLPAIGASTKWLRHPTQDRSTPYWVQRDFNIPSIYLLGTPTISATIRAAGNDQVRAYINGDTDLILEDLNQPFEGGFVTENFNTGFISGENKLRFYLTNTDRESSLNYAFDLSIDACIPIQCFDDIDNDNDLNSGGGIDALQEFIPENNCADITYSNGEDNCDRYGHSYYFGRTDSHEINDYIDSFHEYDDIGTDGAYFCNELDADKLCELKGYSDYEIINLRSVGEVTRTECSRNKCNSDSSCVGFHSNSDNHFALWDPDAANPNGGYSGNLVRISAEQGKRGLKKVLCTNPIPSACWDGIDNEDNDGKKDFCVTPNAPSTFTFEDHYSTTMVPFLNTFGYRTINGGLNDDDATLQKICNLKGYNTVSSHNSRTWSSCGDNDNWYWSSSENNFVNGGGCYNGGTHVTTLTCSDPIDCDPDCESRYDTSEYPHDPQCTDIKDDDEGGPTVTPDPPADPLCDLNQTILIIDHDGSILPVHEDSEGTRICYDYIFNTNNTDPNATMCTGDNVVLKVNPVTGFASIPETANNDACAWADRDNSGVVDSPGADQDAYAACFGKSTTTNPECSWADRDNSGSVGHGDTPEFANCVGAVTNYTDICYDNLECRSISAGSCAVDEFTTVRLSAATEATIGNASSSLPVQICCKIVNPEITGAYWSEPFRDMRINSTDLNSLVRLRMGGIKLEDKTVDYTIKRRTGGFLDFLIPDRTIMAGSEEGFPTWRAGKDENGDLQGGEYYFIVKIDSLGLEFDTSNNPDENYRYLEVSNTQVNNPPTALITFPEDKQIYFIDSPIYFEQASFDIDDGFSYRWELGDGTVKEGNTSNYENYNFTHTYTGEENLGQQNIKLYVTDDRGLGSQDSVSILVINSTFILTYIDQPADGGSFGRQVDFDASSTYAVSSSTNIAADGTCTKEIICLAGNCPSETRGCPTSASLGCNFDTNTCPITVQNAPRDHVPITFNWTFRNTHGLELKRSGNGAGNVAFTQSFPIADFYTASLTASINPSSSAEVDFNVDFESPTCYPQISAQQANDFSDLIIGASYWREDETFKNSVQDCRRLDGVDPNGQPRTTCCPDGYSCNSDNECALLVEITGCQQYETPEECGADSGHPGEASEILESLGDFMDDFPQGCFNNELFGNDNQCRNFVDCRCVWDPDEGDDGLCLARYNETVEHIPSGDMWSVEDQTSEINAACSEPGRERTGACTFNFEYTGSCIDGAEFVTRSWTAQYDNTDASFSDPLGYCAPGSEIIPCERVIRLPFFSFQNIIVAIILLVLIYWFILRDKDHKK